MLLSGVSKIALTIQTPIQFVENVFCEYRICSRYCVYLLTPSSSLRLYNVDIWYRLYSQVEFVILEATATSLVDLCNNSLS